MSKLTMVLLTVLVVGTLILTGCATPGTEAGDHEDGTYRGAFLDRDEMQVNVQFTLEDNTVTAARFRLLQYGGSDYLSDDDATRQSIGEQHVQALEYLVGKSINDSLSDLYEPGDFVDDVDGFSGATIRANKIISAVRDALNRGVYSH